MAQSYANSSANQRYVLRLLRDLLIVMARLPDHMNDTEDGPIWHAEFLANMEKLRTSATFDGNALLADAELLGASNFSYRQIASLLRDMLRAAE